MSSSHKSSIVVQNAHANNLKNISLEIPKHKVVAFTGVSGSGKSSLLFDTIYTEAQRQLIETFSAFARTFMPKFSRPDVDDILNLSTSIVIDQKKMGNNLRSTVGTVTEVNTYLRLLYSRIGQPQIGASFLFSFNHPEGMCAHCNGLGKTAKVDLDLFLDWEKNIREGAIMHPHYKVGGFMWKEVINLQLFDTEKKLKDFNEAELHKLLYAEPYPVVPPPGKTTYMKTFEGIASKLEQAVAGKGEDEASDEDKNAYTKHFKYSICEHCQGSRISEQARSVQINGISFDELCRMELSDVHRFLKNIQDDASRTIISKAEFVLEQLIDIGVGYLTLERPVGTLSGGESQRVKMAKQLDCNLVDMLYVLDEPSTGLHPKDTEKLLALLYRLRDKGNSVYVVEHDPEIIRAAEWIVDVGPKAGKYGGEVVYNGEPQGIVNTESITGKYLYRSQKAQYQRKTPTAFFEINNAQANNLKNVSVKIPKGVLTCVTGVSGSGKSSLIHECFAKEYPAAIVIDQSAVGKTSRANPATYLGVFDNIRKEFSAATQAPASLFSFNSAGACPKCNGQGTVSMELAFLDAVKTQCDECEGKRYHGEVLNYQLQGKNIAEVLDMSVAQALEFFQPEKINKHLRLLQAVGLDYLKLGQSLSTLSGGECQRLKIATELQRESNIYIMDEPTTGLHVSDIEHFYKIIQKLVEANNTVIIIEHNLDIIKHADWIIDMGPEGGKNGGEVLYSGPTEGILDCAESVTGRFLRELL